MFGRLSKLELFLVTVFGTIGGIYVYTPIVKDLNKSNHEKHQAEKDKSIDAKKKTTE